VVYKSLLAVLLVSFTVCYFLVPAVSIIARKLGAVDKPDGKRKIHTRATPRLGGIAIYAGILTGILTGFLYLLNNRKIIYIDPVQITAVVVGSTFVVLIGAADDFFDLKPYEKYLGQVAAAIIALLFGINFSFINLPYAGTISLGIWSYILTIFWITAMMNIMNFIDGLDGLAAGVSAIAGISFLAYLLLKGNLTASIVVVALIGSSLAFLKYNSYPASIFMGDSGSLLLGYIFGVITISGVVKSMSVFSFLVPIVVMGVPIVDTFLAIIRRLRGGKPITEADSKHIHHRLLHKGLSHRAAVFLIYFWSAVLAIAGFTLISTSDLTKLLFFLFAVVSTGLIVWYTGILEEVKIIRYERSKRKR
jgi:UDP-GlcNAc:undecaprenyl-phosphate GlcNAc-1-phosphate transferase